MGEEGMEQDPFDDQFQPAWNTLCEPLDEGDARTREDMDAVATPAPYASASKAPGAPKKEPHRSCLEHCTEGASASRCRERLARARKAPWEPVTPKLLWSGVSDEDEQASMLLSARWRVGGARGGKALTGAGDGGASAI